MNSSKRDRSIFTIVAALSIVILFCLAQPTLAQNNKYIVGDKVVVDLYGDGREIVNAVIESIYDYGGSPPTTYYIKFTDKYGSTSTGGVPIGRIKSYIGGQNPNVKAPIGTSGPIADSPSNRRGETAANVKTSTKASAGDLDYFFGKWKLSRWGGGSTVVRGDTVYREYLMHVAKAAPISINSNGTYSWIVRDGSTVNGKWRYLTVEEDRATSGKNGLVLLSGFDGVDWRVSFNGIQTGKEYIKIYSHLGNFDGERSGAGKGEPAWNSGQFSKGDLVRVTVGGEDCEGEIDKPYRGDPTGLLFYYVYFSCSKTGGRTSGAFTPLQIRRR